MRAFFFFLLNAHSSFLFFLFPKMAQEQYSEVFTNYLIVDTCVLLEYGELIARILYSTWRKHLSFQIVIPIIVRKELEAQTASIDIDIP
jgi:hypothetical protein